MGVKIGGNCKFQFEVVIDYSHYWLIEIGNDVTLAPRVHILAHDASTYNHFGYTKIGKVKIEDNVFSTRSHLRNSGRRADMALFSAPASTTSM